SRKKLLLLGQRNDAIADVAGREHAEFFAERAGAAAFIGHCDDRAEASDRPRTVRVDVTFQSAQQSRKPGAAADSDDVEAVVAHSRGLYARGYSCARRNVSGLLNVLAMPRPRRTLFSDTFPVASAAPSCT